MSLDTLSAAFLASCQPDLLLCQRYFDQARKVRPLDDLAAEEWIGKAENILDRLEREWMEIRRKQNVET